MGTTINRKNGSRPYQDCEEVRQGHHCFQASPQQDCRLHHPFDEAHSTWSRPWYLLQAPREERERKDQYVLEISALDFSQNENGGQLEVDSETKDLLKSLGFDSIPVSVVAVSQQQAIEPRRRFGNDRPARA